MSLKGAKRDMWRLREILLTAQRFSIENASIRLVLSADGEILTLIFSGTQDGQTREIVVDAVDETACRPGYAMSAMEIQLASLDPGWREQRERLFPELKPKGVEP